MINDWPNSNQMLFEYFYKNIFRNVDNHFVCAEDLMLIKQENATSRVNMDKKLRRQMFLYLLMVKQNTVFIFYSDFC